MSEKEAHFSEEEISAIFQDAIRSQAEARERLGKREGLTLDELREIGAELGITAEYIERAAASRKAIVTAKPDKKLLGLPVSVERVMELPRLLTDDEWGQLVADVRETFEANGNVTQDGPFRQWTNGNLSVMVEPYRKGAYRLRLRTVKGDAASGLVAAGMTAGFGLLLVVLLLFKDLPQDPSKYAFAGFFMLASLAAALYTAVTIPKWHKRRSEQFDALAGRVSAMLNHPDNVSGAKVMTSESQNSIISSTGSADSNSVTDEGRVDVEADGLYGTEGEAQSGGSRVRE